MVHRLRHCAAAPVHGLRTIRSPRPSWWARAVLGWHGQAYYAMGAGVRPLVADGVLLAGDAAGLAYPESGEGIRPAIESGRLAATTLVAAKGRYGSDDLAPFAESLRGLHG